MSNDQLLQETNALLKRFMDMKEEADAAMKNMQAESQARMVEIRERQKKDTAEALKKHGVPEEDAEATDEDFEVRMKNAQASAKLNMEKMREADQQYKETLLAELSKQSDLLARIAAKVGA